MIDICPLCGQPLTDFYCTGVHGGEPMLDVVRVHIGCMGCDRFSTPLVKPDTIYLDDCVSGMHRMDSESVDLIVSDPPYLINYATCHRKDKTHDFCKPIQNDSNPELIHDYISECYRILKPNHACYLFCSAKTIDTFKAYALAAGFVIRNTIIWVKNNWTAGDLKAQFGQQYEPILLLNKGRALFHGTRVTDVWEFPRVVGNRQLHQNQKPVELIERCIEKHSNEGNVVFDGFMGSGTTAIAALHTRRRFIGFEIEPRYFWMTHNRLCEEVQHEANRTG